jgi:2-octaprenyl-6-methoxyphenol hydroxylase
MDIPPGRPIVPPMNTDVLIAGGGLNGTALALALAQAGMAVALAEPLPPVRQAGERFDGRAYALAISSQRLLAATGVWARLQGRVQPILGIRVSDGRAGQGASPLTLAFDHAEIEEGPMGFMVEDRHLRPALIAAVEDEPSITRLPVPVTGHAPGPSGVTVTLGDGGTVAAAVLVACDGRTSPTAARAGIRRDGRGYDQASLVAAVAHERPHEGIAHQFFMPPGPLAILPLPGNRSSIVWTEAASRAAAIQALDDDAYLDLLRPRFGDFLGDIRLDGARYSYPLALSVARSFVAPRLALVGDAAHVVHPVAGQGLNAGLKDVGALTEVLVDARRRGEDFGRPEVLDRYQRWRRFDTSLLAAATDGVVTLFSNDNPLARLGRDLGLAAVNAVPSLRRALIREAAGLTGDVPRLNRGLAV